MKVSHAGQEVQAVVVSGEQSAAYGMSDTAEFMLTLADGLYSNKFLAAVREVLCNAWDAHIMVGKTDPIEITIDNQELVIKDFGRHRSLLQRLLSGMQQAQHTGWLPRQDCWPKALRRLCRPVAGA